ncbi:hypothetical protein A3D66_00970 [Candidatus Kaiserbacteria bacterium RIFCSPHIGHO2_02_FULL_50_9]|uniref:Uncharacterized protein n=1 Tax=Candidatus Kaiserbacteria bacterium RIFCSPLOWO2_01_FULL_51_21 TaxID=1798508 RepID=A0A1F6EDC6_9BACT|nr:MAG: hypothetical protein A2761_02655 [Candidatus Kaiserbacteria bacterium RIFCSPHIGHO2_01_FULL_51_33]OGG63584.1 MAG: hypothetical protein A3D66_00970 [Candidatus Kaiserbacteria bacterium RIFCSPHIGHO2_02_FULL_50_9]OGG71678.1 MAG: hypothetical protein A3A35_00745 [Candidatus Kaiserbacteria bacterium RIFCSPLOWO2_01_FULL_51_21]
MFIGDVEQDRRSFSGDGTDRLPVKPKAILSKALIDNLFRFLEFRKLEKAAETAAAVFNYFETALFFNFKKHHGKI